MADTTGGSIYYLAEGYDSQDTGAWAGVIVIDNEPPSIRPLVPSGSGSEGASDGVLKIRHPDGTIVAKPSEPGVPKPTATIMSGESSSINANFLPNGTYDHYYIPAPYEKSTISLNIPYVTIDGLFEGGYISTEFDFIPNFNGYPVGAPVDYIKYSDVLYEVNAVTGVVNDSLTGSTFQDIISSQGIYSSIDGNGLVFGTSDGVGVYNAAGDRLVTLFHTWTAGYGGIGFTYHDEEVWVAESNGTNGYLLNKYDGSDFTLLSSETRSLGENTGDIAAIDSDGNVIIKNDEKIFKYDKDDTLIYEYGYAGEGGETVEDVTDCSNWAGGCESRYWNGSGWDSSYDPAWYAGITIPPPVDGFTIGDKFRLYCDTAGESIHALFYGNYGTPTLHQYFYEDEEILGSYVYEISSEGEANCNYITFYGKGWEDNWAEYAEITKIEKISGSAAPQRVIDAVLVADSGDTITAWHTDTDAGMITLSPTGSLVSDYDITTTSGKTIDRVHINKSGETIIEWHTDSSTGITMLDQDGVIKREIVDDPGRISDTIAEFTMAASDNVEYTVTSGAVEPVFTRSLSAPFPAITLAMPAAETTFAAGAASISLTGGAVEAKVIRPPCANTNFAGVPGLPVTTSRVIILSPIANTSFQGIAAPVMTSIASPIANTDFEGVEPVITVYVNGATANSSFEGIAASITTYDKLIITTPAAETTFTGGGNVYAFIGTILVCDFGTMVYPTPANTETEGVLPSSFNYDLLIIPPVVANTDFTGSEVLHYGTPREILFAVSANSSFEGIETPFFVMAEVAVTSMTGVVGVPKVVDHVVSISESLFGSEQATARWGKTVTESLASADSPLAQWLMQATDVMSLSETQSVNWYGGASVDESLFVIDIVDLIKRFEDTITESLVASDLLTAKVILTVSEYLNTRDAIISAGVFNAIIEESLLSSDEVVATWFISVLSEIGVADTVGIIKLIRETVTEDITMADILSATGIYQAVINDDLSAIDAIQLVYQLVLSDELAMTDTISAAALLSALIAESISAADTVTPTRVFLLTLAEELVAVDEAGSQATFNIVVEELLDIGITIEVDGEIYECFVLNTSKFHPSVYTGFDFNSYCVFRGRAFGANSSGIWELTGDSDNGSDIHTGVMLHNTDFGVSQQKRFRKAYFNISGDQPMLVMESDGERKAYTIDSKGMAQSSRSIHGREWSISVAEFTNMESLDLVPVILARGR